MEASSNSAINRVIVCGGGLAGHMTVAALSRQLPLSAQIIWVDWQDSSDADVLYGTVAGPLAYEFNRFLGVSEPELLLESNSAFCLGTYYKPWGNPETSWIQSFQLPFPIINGVPLHHYFGRQKIANIEPYLISAMAARHGVFAHPPEQSDHPLSRAEYGYQFDPESYARLFTKSIEAGRVEKIVTTIAEVSSKPDGISEIRFANGRSETAQLYVDCSGPKAILRSRLDPTFSGHRRLVAAASRRSVNDLGPPVRTVMSGDYGWQAETSLQGSISRLTVFDPGSEAAALQAHGLTPLQTVDVQLGRHVEAWSGNCVAIGQAAGILEPHTAAPMIVLQRDIERLLSLFPVSVDMGVERREFNRQYANDYENAELFNRAFFDIDPLPATPYWEAARDEPLPEKLARKIEMFRSRGLHVGYDLEPFNAEDWTILHYGMGRTPQRYDRLACQTPDIEIRKYLKDLQTEIEKVVTAMPPHNKYLKGLTQYLAKNES